MICKHLLRLVLGASPPDFYRRGISIQIDILELGPGYTTTIPAGLETKIKTYVGIDFSQPYADKQRERLSNNPSLLHRCTTIVSNTYDLEVADKSADLVVTSCHPPLISSPIKDFLFHSNPGESHGICCKTLPFRLSPTKVQTSIAHFSC